MGAGLSGRDHPSSNAVPSSPRVLERLTKSCFSSRLFGPRRASNQVEACCGSTIFLKPALTRIKRNDRSFKIPRLLGSSVSIPFPWPTPYVYIYIYTMCIRHFYLHTCDDDYTTYSVAATADGPRAAGRGSWWEGSKRTVVIKGFAEEPLTSRTSAREHLIEWIERGRHINLASPLAGTSVIGGGCRRRVCIWFSVTRLQVFIGLGVPENRNNIPYIM